MRRRIFLGCCAPGSEFFAHGQLQTPIFLADFMQQCLNELAIRLCAQDVHHGFVARRETKYKIAPFDSKNMGR